MAKISIPQGKHIGPAIHKGGKTNPGFHAMAKKEQAGHPLAPGAASFGNQLPPQADGAVTPMPVRC